MRKLVLALSAATMVAPVVPIASPATAQSYYQRFDGYYQGYNGRTWHRDGRTYCRKPNGTVGLLVGGAAGALVGRAIDTHGERTTGTLLGAAAGALLGRHIQRNSGNYRCR